MLEGRHSGRWDSRLKVLCEGQFRTGARGRARARVPDSVVHRALPRWQKVGARANGGRVECFNQLLELDVRQRSREKSIPGGANKMTWDSRGCPLYPSDAADELTRVDIHRGGIV